MEQIHTLIREDLKRLADANIPAFTRDLTHSEVRAILVLVRRLKTRLEVLEAEMEKN